MPHRMNSFFEGIQRLEFTINQYCYCFTYLYVSKYIVTEEAEAPKRPLLIGCLFLLLLPFLYLYNPASLHKERNVCLSLFFLSCQPSVYKNFNIDQLCRKAYFQIWIDFLRVDMMNKRGF